MFAIRGSREQSFCGKNTQLSVANCLSTKRTYGINEKNKNKIKIVSGLTKAIREKIFEKDSAGVETPGHFTNVDTNFRLGETLPLVQVCKKLLSIHVI